ncbi:MAG: hypothetical protein GY849_23855, partial [Deltaproteobacteria bacterium]|nr:hypothetical protein [Deltaproteobacteria bacterium]
MLDVIPIPGWRDLADILFLTLVVYQLYIWFRGTRALRVLIGLALMGGIYSLARLWGLFLTTWVFQFLWQVLLILLLILFQSEIRQVLERVSPLRYLRWRRGSSREALPRDLAQTVFDMAGEKTGAIIVLERDDNPAEFLNGGQTIMALPEPALIKSIFNRHGPAHDGALVLSHHRLTRMGCILPLSKREDMTEQYGTRHLAALGLSERTDALCLVVSEERAEVSTVVDGRITIWKNPESLEKRLRELVGDSEVPGTKPKDLLKNAFIRNWGPKLGALTLVLFAWLVLANQQEMGKSMAARIQYTRPRAGLTLDQRSAQKVRLALSGKRHAIEALRDGDVRVRIDLG